MLQGSRLTGHAVCDLIAFNALVAGDPLDVDRCRCPRRDTRVQMSLRVRSVRLERPSQSRESADYESEQAPKMKLPTSLVVSMDLEPLVALIPLPLFRRLFQPCALI